MNIRKMRRLKISSWHDVVLIGLPALLLLAGGFWLAAQFVRPAPPHQLVFSSGGEGSGYQRFAARYQEVLARYDIELVEQPSAGSLENLQRLRDPDSGVDAGFIQGGTVNVSDEDRQQLVSLGGLYYEPLWIFYRSELAQSLPGRRLDQLSQLKGRRIAIGAAGSGTHRLARDLLGGNGLEMAPTRLLETDGLDMVADLQAGRLDAAFVVGPAQSAVVWSLLFSRNIQLMSLTHADAYVRLFPQLQQLTLPRGAIDLVQDVPARDVVLLAPVATLVVRRQTHPALIDLLLQAASEVHGEAGVFQKPHEFPRASEVDLPLAAEAERYYKSGKSFLQRYLPFWLATLIDRMVVLLVPVVALLIPIIKFAPALYGWRVRSRIFRRYGELKFLERELELDAGRLSRQAWLSRLDEIGDEANHLPAPLAFSDMLYTLRQHIELVRAEILRKT
ncbi:MAG: ABC transporter substrate-binding protein [Sterolibacterium sp.]|nr:ABC transporter substrate-binding protein [Sterolibacterium sp.]